MVKVSVRDTDLDSFPVVAWRREIENGECEKGARRMQEVRKRQIQNNKTRLLQVRKYQSLYSSLFQQSITQSIAFEDEKKIWNEIYYFVMNKW